MILSKGIFLNNGKTWFSINKNGERCEMISATECLIPATSESKNRYSTENNSRFAGGCYLAFDVVISCQKRKEMSYAFSKNGFAWTTMELGIYARIKVFSLSPIIFEDVAVHPNKSFSIVCKIESQKLSPRTRYACYLVYKLPKNPYEFEAPMILTDKDFHVNDSEGIRFIYLLSPQIPTFRQTVDQNTHNPLNRPKIQGLPRLRNDGWMQVQISEFVTQFTTKMITVHVELTSSFYKVIEGLTV
ncbi:hypothetical protein L1987_73903 [Smallanthus sonchifolius]|uniref:Uncharacterized protein n=1 Tax=Smallanthus sonchifolius TaxID=185202 RepID=A0ACB9A0I4_9ASTR|nr:hypothetical protein L1987_73903 [Smallanthus sonchifolius]